MTDTRNITPSEPRAIGELHAFSKLLHQRLLAADVGQVVTYRDLSAVIGIDVQQEGRHYLTRARHLALRHDQRVFECVPNIGVKRLPPTGVIATAEGHVAKASRSARRGLAKVSTIDLTAVEPQDATRALVVRAQLGVQRTFGSERTRRELSARAESEGKLPTGQSIAVRSLKMFDQKKD